MKKCIFCKKCVMVFYPFYISAISVMVNQRRRILLSRKEPAGLQKEGRMKKDNFYLRYRGAALRGATKYAQLREIILAAVEDGYFPPGSKLPGEKEITMCTPYSLGTVQRALGDLARQGVVERRHGLGTFVIEKVVVPLHCRFLSDEEGIFLSIYPMLLKRKRVSGKPPWGKLLAARGKNIVAIERSIDIGHEFTVYTIFYVNCASFPLFRTLPVGELDGANLKNILRHQYDIEIEDISYRMKIIELPQRACEVTGTERGLQGLWVGIVTSGANRIPLYYHELFIPPNAREFNISSYSSLSSDVT